MLKRVFDFIAILGLKASPLAINLVLLLAWLVFFQLAGGLVVNHTQDVVRLE